MGVAHYENFPVASLLLPPEFRHPVALIYRFAREADDFADEGALSDADRLDRLERFRGHLRRIERGEPADLDWFAGLESVIRQYRLPVGFFFDLLSAFSQDVSKKRYADFSEVLDYCRRSANPIGRLLLHLFGRATPENLDYSDSICSALQLVNFWQDVPIDYAKDRIYLPQEDLARFGVTEQALKDGRVTSEIRQLLAHQCQRARQFFAAASQAMPQQEARKLVAAEIMGAIYFARPDD